MWVFLCVIGLEIKHYLFCALLCNCGMANKRGRWQNLACIFQQALAGWVACLQQLTPRGASQTGGVNTHTFRNLPLFVKGFKNTTKALTATRKNIHRSKCWVKMEKEGREQERRHPHTFWNAAIKQRDTAAIFVLAHKMSPSGRLNSPLKNPRAGTFFSLVAEA